VVAAIVLALMAAGGSAIAQSSTEYGARPQRVAGTPRSVLGFFHSLEAGSSITDGVEVLNHAGTSMVFDVYAVDMVPSSNGGLAPAPRSADPEGPATWITLESDSADLGRDETELIPFDLAVPTGTPPGEYRAAIVVEPRSVADSGTVVSKTRIALPVTATVLGAVNLGVTLGDLTVVHDDGPLSFSQPITNTGDVTFTASGDLELTSWLGSATRTIAFTPEDLTLAPGETATVRAVWEDPPLFGRYDAVGTIVAVVGERQPVPFTGTTVRVWLVPWALILTGLAALVIVAMVIRALRPRWTAWRVRRREERAVLDDYRRQRRLGGT